MEPVVVTKEGLSVISGLDYWTGLLDWLNSLFYKLQRLYYNNIHASAHFCNGLFCNLTWPETLSSDNLVWPDLFVAQGVSISAQPKKALVQVGCTRFAGPVGVRLGAYSDNALRLQEVWPCETSSARTYRLAVYELWCYRLIIELELLIIVTYDLCTTKSS